MLDIFLYLACAYWYALRNIHGELHALLERHHFPHIVAEFVERFCAKHIAQSFVRHELVQQRPHYLVVVVGVWRVDIDLPCFHIEPAHHLCATLYGTVGCSLAAWQFARVLHEIHAFASHLFDKGIGALLLFFSIFCFYSLLKLGLCLLRHIEYAVGIDLRQRFSASLVRPFAQFGLAFLTPRLKPILCGNVVLF